MWGWRIDKRGVVKIGMKKVTEDTSYRPRLAVIFGGDGADKPQKLGRKEVIVGGCGRRDKICVSISMVVGVESLWWQGPHKRSGETRF